MLKEEEFYSYNGFSRPAMKFGVPLKMLIIAGFIEFPILLLFIIISKFLLALVCFSLIIPIYFIIKILSTKDENIVDIIPLKLKYFLLRKINYQFFTNRSLSPLSKIRFFFQEKPDFRVSNNNLTFLSSDYGSNLDDYKRFFEENTEELPKE